MDNQSPIIAPPSYEEQIDQSQNDNLVIDEVELSQESVVETVKNIDVPEITSSDVDLSSNEIAAIENSECSTANFNESDEVQSDVTPDNSVVTENTNSNSAYPDTSSNINIGVPDTSSSITHSDYNIEVTDLSKTHCPIIEAETFDAYTLVINDEVLIPQKESNPQQDQLEKDESFSFEQQAGVDETECVTSEMINSQVSNSTQILDNTDHVVVGASPVATIEESGESTIEPELGIEIANQPDAIVESHIESNVELITTSTDFIHQGVTSTECAIEQGNLIISEKICTEENNGVTFNHPVQYMTIADSTTNTSMDSDSFDLHVSTDNSQDVTIEQSIVMDTSNANASDISPNTNDELPILQKETINVVADTQQDSNNVPLNTDDNCSSIEDVNKIVAETPDNKNEKLSEEVILENENEVDKVHEDKIVQANNIYIEDKEISENDPQNNLEEPDTSESAIVAKVDTSDIEGEPQVSELKIETENINDDTTVQSNQPKIREEIITEQDIASAELIIEKNFAAEEETTEKNEENIPEVETEITPEKDIQPEQNLVETVVNSKDVVEINIELEENESERDSVKENGESDLNIIERNETLHVDITERQSDSDVNIPEKNVESEVNVEHEIHNEPETTIETQTNDETLSNIESEVQSSDASVVDQHIITEISTEATIDVTDRMLKPEVNEIQPARVLESQNVSILNKSSKQLVAKTEFTSEISNVEINDVPYNETLYVESAAFSADDCHTQQVYIVEGSDNLLLMETEGDIPGHDVEITVVPDDNIEVQLQKINQEKPKEHNHKDENIRRVPGIPCHVLGRNIDNPVDDIFRNGKVPPKPRLGVKIPYRNLTSQICTKQEIENEVMKRQRLKNTSAEAAAGNTLFAKKLTQTLAKKIIPPEQLSPSISTTANAATPAPPAPPKPTINKKESGKIENNSDLLAILEGDGDDINVTAPPPNFDANLKEVEKQIALKQLSELQESSKMKRKKNIRRQEEHIDIKNYVNSMKTAEASPAIISKNKLLEKSTDKSFTPLKSAGTRAAKLISESNIKAEVPLTQKISENIIGSKNSSPTKENTTPSPSNIKVEVKPLKQGHLQDNKIGKNDIQATQVKSNGAKSSLPIKKSMDIKSDSNIKKSDVKSGNKGELNKQSENEAGDSHLIEPLPSTSSSDLKEEDLVSNFSSKLPIKTYTRKRKQPDEETIPAKKPATAASSPNIPANAYVTKSSRIIKKKVIWDPDELPNQRAMFKSPKSVEIKQPSNPTKIVKKVQKIPTVVSVTPAVAPVSVQLNSSAAETAKQPVKILEKVVKKVPIQEKAKRLTEVDKLLMDEGAVNMLYAIKNTDENQNTNKTKKRPSVVSLDNKTKEIKNDLETTTNSKISPKSLRRKESSLKSSDKVITPAAITRQKSRDSNRSSVHSPPASPVMVYPEASRIIRRHSSSSYSSDDEEVINQAGNKDAAKPAEAENTSDRTLRKKHALTSPEAPKPKRVKKIETLTTPERKKTSEETSRKFTKLKEEDVNDLETYETLTIKRMDNLYQIILSPSSNQEIFISNEVLKDMTAAINKLNDDSQCRVILISSSGSSFCHGINYKSLVAEKDQLKKSLAKDLATNVREFLRILAHSPKIVVAGVHGDVEGLGVMMLPLFDMVIASDTATFSTPYGKLGCAPEGGCLLTLPHLMNNVLVSELLLSPRKLIASEAQRVGLVTRVLWPDKFHEELVSSSKLVASQSSQFLETTKNLTRQNILPVIDKGLVAETETLIKHWMSSECQKNFSQYK